MMGNLLFRDSLQALKVGISSSSIPWDEIIQAPLLEHWLSYFSMLEDLKDVSFPRSVRPDNVDKTILNNYEFRS